ncbi:MAG: NPCBM/NEW2 domain-containing protein [Fimbriiglobus sp.]
MWGLLLLGMAVSAGPEFTVASVGGSIVGAVESISAGGEVKLKDGKTVPAGQLVGFRQVGVANPAWPREPGVVLANGDVIVGEVVEGDGETLRFRPKFGEVWRLPVSVLAAAWLIESPGKPGPYEWVTSTRNDTLLLRNRDVLRGTVEGFSLMPGGVKWKAAESEIVLWKRIAAVSFDPSLARVRKPKGAYVRVTLLDGSRVSGTGMIGDDKGLSLTLLSGPKWAIPWKQVARLDVLQGPATWLSDLKPTKNTTTAFQSLAWPMKVNQSVRGLPMKLQTPFGVSTYDQGLGLHSRTSVTYDLAGKYRRLEAVAGLDAETGIRGAVAVEIRLDGQLLPLAVLKLVQAGEAIPLEIDVKGVKALSILVDFGPNGDVQDDFHFADAKLIE